ncbi:ribokinase [Janthinobacterium sp. P210006]|uniref:ribokinase n=1 Tax=Janthinobacterium sp. P210006 TaxID=3112939 RepID=UPI002E27047C|nr:ribokinase [Janthinobacterium sp. P210006]
MIVVIGSINMDLVLRVPRMPLPGETLTGGAFRTIPGGKGANQAVACARMSGKVAGAQQVAMVGCVGDDAFGATLRAALVGDGIIDSHITTLPGVASGIASILVDDNGQNSIVIAGGANDLLSPAHIDAAQGLIEQADIVVLQLETPMDTVVHAIKLARSLGKTVVLNPAPAVSLPDGVLELVDYLIPNEIEAAMLAGVSPDGADAKALAAALQKLGSDNVIITLGSKGVHAALYGGDYTFPAEVVQAVDTTAAGDTFIGGFVAGLASGMDEAESIQQGQRAAAWSVTKPGAQTSIPHLHELF